jgi:DMSO/TMAO reductase YedYZ molybdopterin-dependent catalytic subunit
MSRFRSVCACDSRFSARVRSCLSSSFSHRVRATPPDALAYEITPLGAHYVLNHYDTPLVDVESYRLAIHGAVKKPIQIDLNAVRARPQMTLPVTMDCGGTVSSTSEVSTTTRTSRWRPFVF